MNLDTSIERAADQTTLFRMPSLGADMTDGLIVEWLVEPGSPVTRGQIIVIVETDKSDIEVEVFNPGVIAELLVDEGDRVNVGEPIARFELNQLLATTDQPLSTSPGTTSGERHGARSSELDLASTITSPLVRGLARELHVAPDQIRGTGPGGRVRRDDVMAASPQTRAAVRRITPRAKRLFAARGIILNDSHELAHFDGLPQRGVITGDDVLQIPTVIQESPDVTDVSTTQITATGPPRSPLTKQQSMRRAIAARMQKSWTEIPHYHVSTRLDVAEAVRQLANHNARFQVDERVVVGALLLSAAARCAAAVPEINGWWRHDTYEPSADVHLGVAVSLRSGGLVVPTIEHADRLGVDELMTHLNGVVQRARRRSLRSSDLTEATITVTNLGDLGVDSVSGLIHPPQVALVGFGSVHDEPWAIDGKVQIRATVHATLAGDHRATDGLAGARYLKRLQQFLLDPQLETS